MVRKGEEGAFQEVLRHVFSQFSAIYAIESFGAAFESASAVRFFSEVKRA